MSNPVGVVVMATVSLVIGLAGIAGFWMASKARVPGTSPLMQLFTSALSITFIGTSVLMWRRSRLAAPAFLVALVFPVIVARNIVPSGALLLPSVVVAALLAFPGYLYLRRQGQQPA
jgi:hypothetical protein